ncbi:cell wall-binding repeat 2 family protein [Methanosarcina sp. MSH10X1]|uniref:cell wall-binding repeat 2 family protein n=1 Tax=Methanosarcina sp. MSH10X1 TaxID=2507075 RepID=UPI00197B33AC|nr:cell wall-binding repeat 2 family protein [Methanosarcina sp. MSH10X1]
MEGGRDVIKPLYTLFAVAALAVIFISGYVLLWEPQGEPLDISTAQNENLLELTGSTARLSAEDHIQTATVYSQTIYAAAQDKDRPGAVVLVRDDDPATAIATTRLQHMPVNAPMLFVTGNGTVLPEETRKELERLGPEGVMMDNNVQVYIVGDIDRSVVDEVEKLKLKTRTIRASNPIEFTEVLDEYIAVLESDHRQIVFVASIDALEYAYPAASWNAHMGDGFAYVTPDGVPEETRRILEKRWPYYPYIYVFAPSSVVDNETMAELSQYGHVQRIPGSTPQEMAVRWAGYKDSGHMTSWLVGYKSRSVGWGYAEPGHNLLLANPEDWRTVVPSGVLSHMGKHGFLILTEPGGELPDAARSYLQVIKPEPTYPSQQVFNFAWVLGRDINNETVRELDELLRVSSPSTRNNNSLTGMENETDNSAGMVVI